MVDDLIAALIRDEDHASRELIEECARRGGPMRDALGAVVGPAADWSICESNGQWWLRLHAAFILGLMDDEASGRLLLYVMERLAAGEDEDLEDWLAGYWPALFCNKPESILPDMRAGTGPSGCASRTHGSSIHPRRSKPGGNAGRRKSCGVCRKNSMMQSGMTTFRSWSPTCGKHRKWAATTHARAAVAGSTRSVACRERCPMHPEAAPDSGLIMHLVNGYHSRVRILGEVTAAAADTLRQADAIFIEDPHTLDLQFEAHYKPHVWH